MKKPSYVKFIIPLLSAIIVGDMILYFTIRSINENTYHGYLETQTNDLQVKINSTINSYNLVSKSLFNEIINKEQILSLYQNANSKDTLVQAKVRDSLYSAMSETYQNLRKIDIKQLHFHLPDNTSFLRFHRPGKYGDNLTDVRYSLMMTNKNKVEMRGFEEGRIFNGFRYVFPLIYKGKHLGSVETSYSFEGIGKQLKLLGVNHSCMMIKKSVVRKKVFEEEKSNYSECFISDDYLVENKYNNVGGQPKDIINTIDELIEKDIHSLLAADKNFSTYAVVNDMIYVVSFVSIPNVEGIPVAYIISYAQDQTLQNIINRNEAYLSVSMILTPVLILFIGLFVLGKIKTDKLNKQLLETSESLKISNDKLELAVNEKDKFFSIIAHDLRSPFAGFVGLSEIIVNEAKDVENEEIKEVSDMLLQNAYKVSDLLENLLTWSRMQRGLIPFTPEKLMLKSITDQNLDLLSAKSREKFLIIENKIDKDLGAIADPRMLDTVLRNLLSNAIKFTPNHGNIEIFAKIENYAVVTSIKDSGIGMSKKLLSKLFIISENVSRQGTNGEASSGLGLILCKEFIEKCGGKIWVESETNNGSTFNFSLPISAD